MPHTDETFYKMKCGWSSDPKVLALARFGPVQAVLARDLFSQMIDYARRELTDGMVPVDALTNISHPLNRRTAMRVAMHLADPGPYGALCSHDAKNGTFRILAYAKWNDTAEDVQARKDKGVKAALSRWERAHANGNAPGNAGSNARSKHGEAHGRMPRASTSYTEQEQEQEQEQVVQVVSQAEVADARGDGPTGGTDDGQPDPADEEAALVQALMFGKTGQSIGRDEAEAIRDQLLAGRRVNNRTAYLRSALSTAREARKLLPQRSPAPEPAARSVTGPRADHAAEAHRGAALARQLLADQAAADAAADIAAEDDEPDRLWDDDDDPDPEDDETYGFELDEPPARPVTDVTPGVDGLDLPGAEEIPF